MTGFDPRTPGVGSNQSANWATTIAQIVKSVWLKQVKDLFFYHYNNNKRKVEKEGKREN